MKSRGLGWRGGKRFERYLGLQRILRSFNLIREMKYG
jgi:hypothetical protein